MVLGPDDPLVPEGAPDGERLSGKQTRSGNGRDATVPPPPGKVSLPPIELTLTILLCPAGCMPGRTIWHIRLAGHQEYLDRDLLFQVGLG